MKVILKENVDNLGSLGDEVEVKRGYARNFLIPQGKAVEISSASAKQIGHYRNLMAKERAKAIEEARSLSEKLNTTELVFTMKAGDSGKLFGSIGNKHIEEELSKQGIDLEKRSIVLLSPIKTTGTHKIKIKLHSEVDTFLQVKVQAEKVEQKEKIEEKADTNLVETEEEDYSELDNEE